MNAASVHALGKHLRRTVPLLLPVSVRLVRGLGHYGDCAVRGDRYVIRVRRELSTNVGYGTLLHEFAHAAAWELDGTEDHAEFFQAAVVATYQAYLNWVGYYTTSKHDTEG